jgi:hypothetical protein
MREKAAVKDTDANAVGADVTAEHLADVVRDIAAIDVDDGVVFALDTISVQDIREQADDPGLCSGSAAHCHDGDACRWPRPIAVLSSRSTPRLWIRRKLTNTQPWCRNGR